MSCVQLRLLLRVRYLLKKRRLRASLCEIFLPVLLLGFLVIIRGVVTAKNNGDELTPVTIPLTLPQVVKQWGINLEDDDPGYIIGLAASEEQDMPLLRTFEQNLVEHLQAGGVVNASGLVRTFDTAAEMIAYVSGSRYGDDLEEIGVGVIFNKMGGAASDWEYTIRLPDDKVKDTSEIVDRFQVGLPKDWGMYASHGFHQIQRFVDNWIIERSASPSWQPPVKQEGIFPFPVSAYLEDGFQGTIRVGMPLLLILSFMLPFSRIVREIVEEKEERIKEGMRMVGMRDSAFWASWVITYLFIFFLTSIFSAVTLKLGNVLQYTDGTLVFLLFLSFTLALIALATLITVFFSKGRVASTVGLVVLFGSFLPYLVLADTTPAVGTQLLLCLLPPAAFGFGIRTISDFETGQVALSLGNWTEEVDGLSVASITVMLWFDAALFFFLTWYLDKTVKSEFGQHQHPLFCCQPKYWAGCCSGRKRRSENGNEPLLSPSERDTEEDIALLRGEHLEPVSEEVRRRDAGAGIRIRQLTKIFTGTGREVVALDGLSLDMYSGQIFALLGHNGAGKSTTINLLTGMFESTSGRAYVGGRDISTDMDEIRKSMGVCPQHSVLWPLLTPREHLTIFATLKGVPKANLQEEVERMLEEIHLTGEADTPSEALSGGMKRKLSVGMAFIGGSKIVYLDEPSSGCDPYSRRELQDLIRNLKKDRVIVLTTHYLDEADALADRIGIMAHGVLRACGSSLFLKSRYGVGYTLVLGLADLDAKGRAHGQGRVDRSKIEKHVMSFVPTAEKLSDAGTEMSFRLPFSSSKDFPAMFAKFDDPAELGVANYGISVTTLEEVFLRVAEEDTPVTARHRRLTGGEKQELKQPDTAISIRSGSESSMDEDVFSIRVDAQQGDYFYMIKHIAALITKRFRIARRDRRTLLTNLFLPVIILSLGLGLMSITGSDSPSLALTTEQYPPPQQLVYSTAQGLDTTAFLAPLATQDLLLTPVTADDVAGFQEYLLKTREKTDPSRYGALYFEDAPSGVTVAVSFNATGLHALPVFNNLLANALLKNATGSADAAIRASSFPWPQTPKQKRALDIARGFSTAVVVILAFAFIPAGYARFVVYERYIKAKHQQLVSGVEGASYWLSSFAFDALSFLVPGGISIIVILIFSTPSLVGGNFPTTLMLFLFYGASIISFSYLTSFLFDQPGSAQSSLLALNLLSGLVLMIASFIMALIESTMHINQHLIYVYRLFPSFCLGNGLMNMVLREVPLFWPDRVKRGAWDWDVSGANLLFMFLETILYLALCALIEKLQTMPAWLAYFRPDPVVPYANPDKQLDPDVEFEKQRIFSGAAKDDAIQVAGIRKVYRGTVPKVAIEDLYLAVPQEECLGFLGVTGAGKTTTLAILAGEFPPTSGRAFIGGYDVVRDQKKARRLIGYCPQFDALFDLMTAREHLEMYARIKGVPEESVSRLVNGILREMTLEEYADRPSGTYSGGNKRKLSVACALIGNPPIVLLDEPSAGVDPVSRRFMWSFISKTMKGRSVILTTHSMEECEALSHRIGIMVNGELQCIGTAQRLKERFGQGYSVEMRVNEQKDGSVSRLIGFMSETFPGSELTEPPIGGAAKFRVPLTAGTRLGGLFKVLEENKHALAITEYSVSQTTLEQVFLFFARKQLAPEVQNPREEETALFDPPNSPSIGRHPSFGRPSFVSIQ